MPRPCNKLVPSDLDNQVWKLWIIGTSRKDIAKITGISLPGVDYHIKEAKRICGLDVTRAKAQAQGMIVPIAMSALQLINKAFASNDPKYLDGAIKFLRNAGYTIEQTEQTIRLVDSKPSDESFNEILAKWKREAVDPDDTPTPTSLPEPS